MAPIKSNSLFASYFDFFSKTGKDAVTPAPPIVLEASGGTKINYNNVNYHIFTGTAPFSTPADFKIISIMSSLVVEEVLDTLLHLVMVVKVVVEQVLLLINPMFLYQEQLVSL